MEKFYSLFYVRLAEVEVVICESYQNVENRLWETYMENQDMLRTLVVLSTSLSLSTLNPVVWQAIICRPLSRKFNGLASSDEIIVQSPSCLSVPQSIAFSVCLFDCLLCLFKSVYLPNSQLPYLSLSVCLCVCLSVSLSLALSID